LPHRSAVLFHLVYLFGYGLVRLHHLRFVLIVPFTYCTVLVRIGLPVYVGLFGLRLHVFWFCVYYVWTTTQAVPLTRAFTVLLRTHTVYALPGCLTIYHPYRSRSGSYHMRTLRCGTPYAPGCYRSAFAPHRLPHARLPRTAPSATVPGLRTTVAVLLLLAGLRLLFMVLCCRAFLVTAPAIAFSLWFFLLYALRYPTFYPYATTRDSAFCVHTRYVWFLFSRFKLDAHRFPTALRCVYGFGSGTVRFFWFFGLLVCTIGSRLLHTDYRTGSRIWFATHLTLPLTRTLVFVAPALRRAHGWHFTLLIDARALPIPL